jgi:methylenetetrahydrofolate dehydrogenase (NADP+) / methenyltetrahydrofolate cyclohydrolase
VTARRSTSRGYPPFVIDGKAVSNDRLDRARDEAGELAKKGIVPGLATVLVGENPASRVYVAAKSRAAKACGFHSEQFELSSEIQESELLALILRLNEDPLIHGILVQLPLPPAINPTKIMASIAPHKDVDGFHPINVWLAASGDMSRALLPCTPAGAMILIDKACVELETHLSGKSAVIIGRSSIVGRPMANLLLARDCTVTIAHSKSRNLPDIVRGAAVIVAAVGQPEMVRGDWIAPGAIVIDVGINRLPATGQNRGEGSESRLVGDVDFATASLVAGAITPVPGGVGPMTIAMLMTNTLIAACRANSVAEPMM